MFLNKKEAKLSISWLTRACNQHLSSSSTGPIVAILVVKICDETRCLSFSFDATLVVGMEDREIKAHILKSTGEDFVETE